MNTTIRKAVDELKKHKEVKAVYLFGSYAKGTNLPFSDIDICILTEKRISSTKKANIIANSSDNVDIVLFSELPVTIRYRILKEGKLLFVRNEAEIHSAAVQTLKEYLDYRPLIERFSEEYFGDRKWIDKE